MTVGLLDPLYKAVAWVILQIHGWLSNFFGPASGWTWALTIVLLVVIVRLILFPLFVKQIHAQRKMADLQPQLQELRKKYKGDKQRMNEEQMKLFRENGANPISGCLPLVFQLPVFIALFTVLRAIAQDQVKYGMTHALVTSAQHAHILGVTVATTFLHASGASQFGVSPTTARIVIPITVLISGATTYLTVRQSMRRNVTAATSDNPMMQSQKLMAYVAPLFALSGLYWQYGLVLYWVCTNLWTLGQQHYIFRKYPQPSAAGAAGGQAPAGSVTGPRKGAPAQAVTAKSGAAKGTQTRTGASRTGAGRSGPARSGTARTGAPRTGAPRTGAPRTGATKGSGPGRVGASGRGTAGSLAGTGSANSDGGRTGANGQGGLGLGRLLRGRGQEPAEPEQPQDEAEQPKIVRRQPVRQSRSKRTGKG